MIHATWMLKFCSSDGLVLPDFTIFLAHALLRCSKNCQ